MARIPLEDNFDDVINKTQRGLKISDADLARITQPVLLVYGTADPTGGIDIWRRVVGGMPRAELEVVDGAGHQPWFDAPAIAGRIRQFAA